MEQDAKVPLVTQSPGIRHLAEEICQQDRHTALLERQLMPHTPGRTQARGSSLWIRSGAPPPVSGWGLK